MNIRKIIKKYTPISLIHMRRMAIIKSAMRLPLNEYEQYLCKFYYDRTQRIMDFDNPVTFSQKQQWLKLYGQDETMTALCDKYRVREYIAETIGDEFLIPLIKINGKDHFKSADEIDFSKLPKSFAIKCNHGSNANVIVKDKDSLTDNQIKQIKKQLNYWLSENYAYFEGLELQYSNIEPCIIIEKYMAFDEDLPDYKFLCFSGSAKYVWCDQGRYKDHRRTAYDLSYKKMPFHFYVYEDVIDNTPPENLEEMIIIANSLCSNYPFVRVDLYNVKGKIYFGELTFSSGSGVELIYPEEYERMLGDLIVIDQSKRDNNYTYRK